MVIKKKYSFLYINQLLILRHWLHLITKIGIVFVLISSCLFYTEYSEIWIPIYSQIWIIMMTSIKYTNIVHLGELRV